MLVWFFDYLSRYYHAFNVFEYITLRAVLAALTGLIISLLLGAPIIRRLKRLKVGQVVRTEGPKSHYVKTGTPTMGGVLILLSMTISSLLWAKWNNPKIWMVLLLMLSFGLIGWLDDYRKVTRKDPKGLASRWKYFWQSCLALLMAVLLYQQATLPVETQLLIPFFKHLMIPMGLCSIVFTYFVLVGTSNAVNLTDGLDGLAIMPLILIGGALGIFAYVSGNLKFAEYLSLPYIPGVGELTIVCGTLVGAGLGFLWFNTYPAQVFMGDVGSLGLGAALGLIAVLVRQELVLFLMGGIFVVETLSVIVQVASFKLTGRRVFKMAPIHHHFELAGWPEPRIIVRFWIITVVLVLCGLATLKLR